jgi:hypothetical protein
MLAGLKGRNTMISRLKPYLALAVSGAMLVAATVQAQTIKADHTTVDVSAIPVTGIDAARALRMSFSHASVGGNIWSGLTTLAKNATYAFPNWKDNDRGNPGWEAKITEFESWVAEHASEYDVFQNKFCFIDNAADFAPYRDSMVRLAATYPSKKFVWWTMPITTGDSDNAARQTFNQQVRAYCKSNDRPLYDIADIESHKTDGTAVTASGSEALDSAQSSDVGHLNDLGSSRAAAAQWALMAQLGGTTVASSPAGPVSSSSVSSAGSDSGSGEKNVTAAKSDGSGCAIAHPSHANRGVLGCMGLLAIGMFMRRRGAAANVNDPSRSSRA